MGALMTVDMRSVLLATAVAGTILGGMGAPALAMELRDAVSLAVTTNPEVGVVSNDRRAIDQELRQGRALYYPQIDLRGATGPEFSDNATTRADGRNNRTLWRKEGSLTL